MPLIETVNTVKAGGRFQFVSLLNINSSKDNAPLNQGWKMHKG